jgi:hypothetical protein
MSLEDLLARADGPDGPGRGGPDLPERQQTLRATIEWSYRLLQEPEASLLECLSVFAGGWTLEAAEAVGDVGEVADTLAALLDKSLVTVDRGSDGRPRFGMLGTIRAFAAEQLAARPDAVAVRARHLAWVRRLGAVAQPFLCGVGQAEWLVRIDPERANIRHAVRHALDTRDDEAVVEVAWDVVVYYFVREAVDEPHAWLSATRDAGRPLPRVLDARLRCLLALTRVRHGDRDAAGADLRAALAVFREEGMRFEAAVALHQLGFVLLGEEGDAPGAVRALEESSRLFDEVGHDWGVALAEAMLGSVLMETGDDEAAERHLVRSLETAEGIACDSEVVQALTQLAVLRLLQGNPEAALSDVEAVIPRLRAGRFLTDATYALDVVAAIAAGRGQPGTAAEAAATAREVRRRLGVAPWPGSRTLVERTAVPADGTPTVAAGVDAVSILERLVAVLGAS